MTDAIHLALHLVALAATLGVAGWLLLGGFLGISSPGVNPGRALARFAGGVIVAAAFFAEALR